MATAIMEAFSLTHAQVLDGSTAFADVASDDSSWGDIYGVDQASLDPDTDSFDNTGDDVTLSTWEWLNFATLNVRAGYISFPLIAELTGRTISSSGSGSTQIFELDLWHEDSFNVSPRPVLIRMPSRDSAGTVRTLDIGLYKVSFAPMTFDGPAYKDGLKANYNGKALLSQTDELGVAHADGKKRVGKLISRGQV